MSISKSEARVIMNEVMKRAQADGEYRDLALKDPQAAVKKVAPDLKLPVDFEFRFVEDESEVDNPETTFVLPKLQTELSDDELDEVAGGHSANTKHAEDDCFLTSATCRTLVKEDNCKELMVLRDFRDNWLKYQSYGPALIKEYYEIAPKIVEEIEKREESRSIYQDMWKNYIKICYDYIQEKDYINAVEKYKEMVNGLNQLVINLVLNQIN